MAGLLEALGFQSTTTPSDANVVVLNTCSIRDHAEQKVYSYIGPHANRKKKGESVAIVVAGEGGGGGGWGGGGGGRRRRGECMPSGQLNNR